MKPSTVINSAGGDVCNIDVAALRKQYQTLLCIYDLANDTQQKTLDGLLALLDTIAVDLDGEPIELCDTCENELADYDAKSNGRCWDCVHAIDSENAMLDAGYWNRDSSSTRSRQ